MTIQEYRRILAERNALQNLLDRLPSSRVIERRGLEFRKRKVDEMLASRPRVLKEPAVRRVEKRLGSDHVLNEEQQMTGRFLGVLPSQRRFEFRNEATGRVVSGRIDPALKDAGAINEVLDHRTRITVVARRVGSAGSRYVLLAYELAGD